MLTQPDAWRFTSTEIHLNARAGSNQTAKCRFGDLQAPAFDPMYYTKLSDHLTKSTIWDAPHTTRIVWITMLSLADRHGEIHSTIPGLAHDARVTIKECQEALEQLKSPDPFSSSADLDGARIIPIEGGWELVNARKYRLLASHDEARLKTAERVRRHRERKTVTVTQCNAPVTQNTAKDKQEAESKEGISNTYMQTLPGIEPSPKASAPAAPAGVCVSQEVSALVRYMDDLAQPVPAAKPTQAQTDCQGKVSALFRRRPTTPWSAQELKAWKANKAAIEATSQEDWELLAWFYSLPAAGTYRRTSLGTLLNNFTSEIDRAQQHRQKVTFTRPAPIPGQPAPDPFPSFPGPSPEQQKWDAENWKPTPTPKWHGEIIPRVRRADGTMPEETEFAPLRPMGGG